MYFYIKRGLVIMDPCVQEKEVARLSQAVKDIQHDIITLKEDKAEMKVYVSLILERLDKIDSKIGNLDRDTVNVGDVVTTVMKETLATVSTNNSNNTKTWQLVITELIKLVATVGALIAGIKLSGIIP